MANPTSTGSGDDPHIALNIHSGRPRINARSRDNLGAMFNDGSTGTVPGLFGNDVILQSSFDGGYHPIEVATTRANIEAQALVAPASHTQQFNQNVTGRNAVYSNYLATSNVQIANQDSRNAPGIPNRLGILPGIGSNLNVSSADQSRAANMQADNRIMPPLDRDTEFRRLHQEIRRLWRIICVLLEREHTPRSDI